MCSLPDAPNPAQFYIVGSKLTLAENKLLGQRYNQQFFT